MEFDKSKVYTAVNADELKVGSKCIFAHNLSYLRDCVEDREVGSIETLKKVRPENYCDRFFDGTEAWNLAYLVAEPAKLQWTDLKIGDIIRSGEFYEMVTGIHKRADTDKHIFIQGKWISDIQLTEWEKVNDKD